MARKTREAYVREMHIKKKKRDAVRAERLRGRKTRELLKLDK